MPTCFANNAINVFQLERRVPRFYVCYLFLCRLYQKSRDNWQRLRCSFRVIVARSGRIVCAVVCRCSRWWLHYISDAFITSWLSSQIFFFNWIFQLDACVKFVSKIIHKKWKNVAFDAQHRIHLLSLDMCITFVYSIQTVDGTIQFIASSINIDSIQRLARINFVSSEYCRCE